MTAPDLDRRGPRAGTTRWLLPAVFFAIGAVALPTAADAQVRSDRNRQLRGLESPCGADECHHGTYLRDLPPVPTGVVGHTGQRTRRLALPEGPIVNGRIGDNTLIRRLTVGERGDEPCFLRLEGNHDATSWNGCGGDPRTLKLVSMDGPMMLVGVKVCTNNRNDERGRLVKGIELRWARRPHELGAALRHEQTDLLRQPNCADWGGWRICYSGTAARTLIAHHDLIGGRRALVGLQLECLPVEPRCYNARDEVWRTYSPPMLPCSGEVPSPDP